jgi:hypothetical protein
MKRRLMTDNCKVQITLTAELCNEIEGYADELGFDSIQHFTRVLYRTILNENLRFNLVTLSDRPAGIPITAEEYANYRNNEYHKNYRKRLRSDRSARVVAGRSQVLGG